MAGSINRRAMASLNPGRLSVNATANGQIDGTGLAEEAYPPVSDELVVCVEVEPS